MYCYSFCLLSTSWGNHHHAPTAAAVKYRTSSVGVTFANRHEERCQILNPMKKWMQFPLIVGVDDHKKDIQSVTWIL